MYETIIRIKAELCLIFSKTSCTFCISAWKKKIKSKMSDHLYQVVEIDGKGLGCIATQDIKRGTVILREHPQLAVSLPDYTLQVDSSPMSIIQIMTTFNGMKKDDQTEYLKLSDSFLYSNLLPSEKKLEMQSYLEESRTALISMGKTNDEAEKMLRVFGIYLTNCFHGGVCFKSARFNHSCRHNACDVGAYFSKVTGMYIFSIRVK